MSVSISHFSSIINKIYQLNNQKLKTDMDKSESRKVTNHKHYLKRLIKETTDSNLGKRKVVELNEQLLLLNEENQMLRKSLETSKSTVQRLEEQIAIHNSCDLPQLTAQPKVTKKKNFPKIQND